MALAAACGLIAANIYYAQPLIGLIGPSLGLPVEAAGLVVTLTQIGYCLGLALVVPLGDLLENRRLICTILCVTAVALAAACLAPTVAVFLAACLAIGVSSVVAQILVPLAAHLAPGCEPWPRRRECHERSAGGNPAGTPRVEPHRS